MKPKKKRIGSFLLALLTSVSLALPTTVFAEPDSTESTAEQNADSNNPDADANPDSDKPASYLEPVQTNEIEGWPQGPAVYAQSAVVMEADTGAILYAKNMDQQLYPASITKIMTTLVALENSRPDERVSFSEHAIFGIERDSSHIGIRVGEILSMQDCLYGMMLESANEVCLAVAEHISGSVEAFVELMNQKAAELGCTGTHFTNPNGLPDENHYTTAHDMALIAQAAYAREDFRTITKTLTYKIGNTNVCGENRWLSNHHKMLQQKNWPAYYYEGATGGKTGYTQVALNTLVTYANRNDMDLICVTMKTEGRQVYTDTALLFDYGFSNFHKEALDSKKAAPVTTLIADSSVLLGQPLLYTKEPCNYVVLPNDLTDTSALMTHTSCDSKYLTEQLTYKDQILETTRTNLQEYSNKLLSSDPIYQWNCLSSIPTATNTPSDLTESDTKGGKNSMLQSWNELPSWKYAALGLLGIVLLLYLIMLIFKIRKRRRRRKRLRQLKKRY